MLFLEEEKVFSLSRTVAAVPHGDITALFEELFCYLLVAGLYREGEGDSGVHWVLPNISDKNFDIPGGSYRSGIGRLITKGLRDRFLALSSNRNVNEKEADVLTSLDGIFTPETGWFASLTGRDLLGIAFSRNFSYEMKSVAAYVAMMFGQSDFPEDHTVPRLYLSVFGNIHFSKEDMVVLTKPVLRYGFTDRRGNRVTALWSLLSAQIPTLAAQDYPGNYLGDVLSSLTFLAEKDEFEKSIPIPRYAATLYLQRVIGIDSFNPVSLSALFYSQFLYGSTEDLELSRQPLLKVILDLMMERMGEANLDHLFTNNSFYRKLVTTKILHARTVKRPAILQFALETLDTDVSEQSDDTTPDDLGALSDDPSEDPQTDDGGYDPSTPLPAVPLSTPNLDKDTIDLISFDKSGEGVNEDLYRDAVVALNSRLQNDASIPISADVKDSLDYWVNGFLYRTAISATKDQIELLKLQQYLKNVSTKG